MVDILSTPKNIALLCPGPHLLVVPLFQIPSTAHAVNVTKQVSAKCRWQPCALSSEFFLSQTADIM